MAYEKQPVYCYDNRGNYLIKYDSLTDFAKNLGVQVANVSISVKKGIKCKGFYLSYDKVSKYKARNYRRGGQRMELRNINSRKWIKCETYSEASELTGSAHSTIRNAAKRERGFLQTGWYIRLLEKEVIPKYIPSTHRENKRIPVTLIKNKYKRTFESIQEAAETLGINRIGIIHVLKGRYKTTEGYYVENA
jgi:hypothetical protein